MSAAILGSSKRTLVSNDTRRYENEMSSSNTAKFVKSVTGDVVLPSDRMYAELRRVKNRAINKRPAMIVKCADQRDVQLSIDFARRSALQTAVRSGGHSFGGHGVCDDGVVIDLSAMKKVQIDPVQKKVTIEPGIITGELDCPTQSFRMAVPLGSCHPVRVAGYSLGGGESSRPPKLV